MGSYGNSVDRIRLHHSPVFRSHPRDARSRSRVFLSLIFCGVMALVISIWEYHWGLRYLWGGNFAVIAGVTREGKQTPLLAVAILLACIGTFAFFAVLFRLA